MNTRCLPGILSLARPISFDGIDHHTIAKIQMPCAYLYLCDSRTMECVLGYKSQLRLVEKKVMHLINSDYDY